MRTPARRNDLWSYGAKKHFVKTTVTSHDPESIKVFTVRGRLPGRGTWLSRCPPTHTTGGRIPTTFGRRIRASEVTVTAPRAGKWPIFEHAIGPHLIFNLSRPRRRSGTVPGACAVSGGWVRVILAPQRSSYDPVNGRCEHHHSHLAFWLKNVIFCGPGIMMSSFGAVDARSGAPTNPFDWIRAAGAGPEAFY